MRPTQSHPHALLRRLRLDCRHYRGDRPCAAGVPGVCPEACESYARRGPRVLIIKLGALGDVIRTAAILESVRAAWPGCEITWVTRPNGVRMLANHPLIDRLLPLDGETLCHLEYEHFDVCLSLDKEPGPAALAMRVDARERRGVGLSVEGVAIPLNPECETYFRMGLDDELKFRRNDKTYQQLVCEALGLPYERRRYRLYPDAQARAAAEQVWRAAGVSPGETVIGLNTGAGAVFANKNWPPQRYIELARRLTTTTAGRRVALLGGPAEAQRNLAIARSCPAVVDTGADHDEPTFAALVSRCDVVVTGDTMAMHVAIAFGVPCVVLFGPTCPQEIDLYDRGEIIVTGLPCAPCYRRSCEIQPNCMDDIGVERVLEAVERWVDPRRRKGAGSRTLPVVGALP